jgi:hypothetical protein
LILSNKGTLSTPAARMVAPFFSHRQTIKSYTRAEAHFDCLGLTFMRDVRQLRDNGSSFFWFCKKNPVTGRGEHIYYTKKESCRLSWKTETIVTLRNEKVFSNLLFACRAISIFAVNV